MYSKFYRNYILFYVLSELIGVFYSYGMQQGKKVTKVLGVKKNDKIGLVAVVRYGDGEEYELVPSYVC